LRHDGLGGRPGLGIAPNANLRKRITEWLAEEDQVELASNNPGHALLFSNAAIRGALTAVLWINKPAAPIKPFATIADAGPWVRERLFDAGVEVSPAMEDLLANRM